jgi:hypothetical protein
VREKEGGREEGGREEGRREEGGGREGGSEAGREAEMDERREAGRDGTE